VVVRRLPSHRDATHHEVKLRQTILAAVLGAGLLVLGGSTLFLNSKATATAAPPTTLQPIVVSATAPIAFMLRVTSEGNSARYLVQEQLVGFDLPNEAIGVTQDIAGSIAFDSAGRIVPSASRIQVGVASLRSDKDRRDGFVKARVLETDRYPDVVFVATSIQGIALPLPTSGTHSFTLAGNLTIRGIARPVTWKVNATFTDDTVKGTGSTSFAFDDFGLTQPHVPVVLSVADTIRLEHQFTLTR
jgi:polyisoprenoid-binding protein YceI